MLFSLMLFVFAINAYAETTSVQVAVIYPEVKSVHRKVFDAIIEGVKSHPNAKIQTFNINNNTAYKDVEAWLNNSGADVVISLGKRCYEIASNIKTNIPVVAGALVLTSSVQSGVSLMGNPEEFIRHLRIMAPTVNRIHAVYSENNSGWIIRIARELAKKNNIELAAYEAKNIQDAAVLYRNLVENIVNDKDAIWLLMDKVVPDKAILPTLLQEAWEKNFIIFSSNPLHVKKGTLFALYPDYKQMGHDLAELSTKQVVNNERQRLLPATNLKIAVNVRTASHLGINFSKQELRAFNVVFPSR